MAKFNKGYSNIKVELKNWEGDNLAKRVYDFGRLSHDFIDPLPNVYEADNPDCIKLINKIIEGTTLPKFAFQGHSIEFAVYDMSRICLAQLTRDPAFFASASTGVFPLSQEFNLPISIYDNAAIMGKLTAAQELLEQAYIIACEAEIPSIEARYVGLHPQVISCTARYTSADFVRACYSRTSSNFCDECNYIYRKMWWELTRQIQNLNDANSRRLWQWLITEKNCINDGLYKRERLFNSDFTADIVVGGIDLDNRPSFQDYNPEHKALNDWRKSGWKKELERMAIEEPWLLTDKEHCLIEDWAEHERLGLELPTTYDGTQKDILKNAIKEMDYYESK